MISQGRLEGTYGHRFYFTSSILLDNYNFFSLNIIFLYNQWRSALVKDNEISSTEKLLALIRDENTGKPEPAAPKVVSSKTSMNIRPFLYKTRSSNQIINVGLYFSNENLLLVRVDRASGETPRLLDYAEVALEPGITGDRRRFSAFISSVLMNYCGPVKQVHLWVVVSSAYLARRLLIPRVPKKQIFNAVYWSYKKNVPFDDGRDIFDFEVLGNITEDGVKKIEISACSLPKKVVDELQLLFFEAGYPLAGISSLPFAIQNMFRAGWVENDGEDGICTIYIDLECSHINIYSNRNLALSRVIKAGIHSMQEALRDMLESGAGQQSELTSNKDAQSGDAAYVEKDQVDRILSDFIQGSRSSGIDSKTLGLNKGDIFRAILPALERLVKQVERTLKHYYLNFGNKKVRKVLISGLINDNSRIAEYIGSQLGINIEIFNPFPGKMLRSDKGSIPLKSGAMVPAAGVALSDNKITPNFLFTYRDKEKSVVAKRVNSLLFAFLIFLMAVCVGIYLTQNHTLSHKRSLLSGLNREIESYIPNVDRDLLLKMADRAARVQSKLDDITRKHLGLAVISELSDLATDNIRLLSIKSRLGGGSVADKNSLDMEGLIFGDRMTFETLLGSYLVKLKESLLFEKPVIKKNVVETYKGKEVLRFSVSLELLCTRR
jgi:Tfp pilus assembly PilM family ATPase